MTTNNPTLADLKRHGRRTCRAASASLSEATFFLLTLLALILTGAANGLLWIRKQEQQRRAERWQRIISARSYRQVPAHSRRTTLLNLGERAR